jgi:serine/threonine protein kinase/tetratricopeptide (TPR) repeat protein
LLLKKIRSSSSIESQKLSKAQKLLLWRLSKEAEYLAILEHPNIIPLYDREKRNTGESYFTMRKVEGKTLAQILKEKQEGSQKYQELQLLSLFQKVCDAVGYAHSRSIIHRDLKPANIMLGSFGEVYVMDWGIAKKLGSKEENPTEETEAFWSKEEYSDFFQTIGGLGTPGYMSPEQIACASEVDCRTDIFALGRILRECFTGYSPSEEFQKIFQFHKAHRQGKALLEEDPEKYLQIPPDIQAIVLKATDPVKENRYASVQALVNDLELYQKNMQVSARQYPIQVILWKWMQRNKKRILFLSFLVLLLLLFWGYHLQRKSYEEQERKALLEKERSEKWQNLLKEADQEEQEAFALGEPQGNQEIEQQISSLLSALHFYNSALQIQPNSVITEEKKLKVGEALLNLCYQTQDYKLAHYVAKDLGNLSQLPSSEKKRLLEEVENERNRIATQHLTLFKNWEARFRSGNQTQGEVEEALFAIAKMPEEAIFEELISILKEALTYFFQESSRHPKTEEFYHLMGTALGRLENPKAAPYLLDALKQLAKKLAAVRLSNRSPSETRYLIILGQALGYCSVQGLSREFLDIRFALGKDFIFWTETEQTFKKLATLDQMTKFSASSAKEYHQRGFLKYETKDDIGALEDLTQSIEKDPQQALTYLHRGWVYSRLLRYKEAIEDYNYALRLQPQSADIYQDRGLAQFQLKNYKAALEDYTNALRLNPEFIVIYNNRALVHQSLGNYAAALQDYQQVLERDPQFTGAYNNRGHMKQLLEDLQGALDDYNTALKFFPKDTGILNNRASLKASLKDFEGALRDWTIALEIDPQNASFYYNRGLLKYNFNRIADALPDFDQALRLNSHYGEAYFLRGTVKIKLKQFQEALEDYQQAENYLKTDPDLYRNRGLLWIQLKDEKKALDDLTEAFRLNPHYVEEDVFQDFSTLLLNQSILSYRHKDFERSSQLLVQLQSYLTPAHPLSSQVQKMLEQVKLQSTPKKE